MSAVFLLFKPISEQQIYLEKKHTPLKYPNKQTKTKQANKKQKTSNTIARKAHLEPYANFFLQSSLYFTSQKDQSTSSKTMEKCYMESCNHEGIFRESPLDKKEK